jgi:acetyl esterase/lipase
MSRRSSQKRIAAMPSIIVRIALVVTGLFVPVMAQDKPPSDDGFVALFDGKSLAGWGGAKDAYAVENQAIVCLPGNAGNLLTEKEFSDFVLRFDFKLTHGANNGLGIRCPMQPRGNLHLDGVELQILDDSAEKYKTLQPYQYHGSVYGIQPAKRTPSMLKPIGEWNSQEVSVQDRQIKVVLNGGTIVDCNLDDATQAGTLDGVEHPGLKRTKGHIGFLGHGDRVEFRNIRIKELSKAVVERPDVVYGRVHGAALLADVAFPESREPIPAIISVHGGRWVGGHKRDASTIRVRQWAEMGFFAMSIDYRLRNCTPAPACYQDLQCAIRYLQAHANEFNIDRDRIFLIGQSAGGHMVSLAATLGDGPYPRTGGWEQESNDFRAAISVAAPYELLALDWGELWAPPGVPLDQARTQASPTSHVTDRSKPLLIMHSDNDQSVPIANALTMVGVLGRKGAQHIFHRYPEMGHMGINDEVIAKSLAFIRTFGAK